MRTDLLAASNLENDDSYVLKKSQEKSLLKLLITKLLSKNKFWQKNPDIQTRMPRVK